LLAEDNPGNQLLFRTILEKEGLVVDVVSDGQEAIDACREIAYDLVLMDVSMPDVDGLMATREIRATNSPCSQIPIIALTAHQLDGDRERFLAAGMNDYLGKPVEKEALLSMIGQWVTMSNQAEMS
ncbi:MAG: response regulator, partial [Limnobacter sp.]|nr:response regulator [Limnobacter sp.]